MINWLLIGIGDIAIKRVLPAIETEPRSTLYGVVSRDWEKGRRHSARVWTELSAALEDPAIDAVYVATPVALHASQTIAALRAGKHVLCEKPMAMNYREALSMEAAAEASGKTLGIAYFRRSFPKVLRALEVLETGAIGRPLLAEIQCHEWLRKSEFRGWLFDPKLSGGGPLFDIGSHRIDVLNMFFGRPVRVSGQLFPRPTADAVEDNATLIVEYERGVRGMVDVRWDARAPRDEFRITGTEGEMQLSPLSDPELRYNGVVEYLPCHANRHYPCLENFVDAVADGAPLRASGATSVWTDWVTGEANA
jgi:1,5-anhydro-D-fructose reductase (1,5-anhydro-D-mannitol-forming)